MHGLASKGLTFEIIQAMDLLTAYKEGRVKVVDGVISRGDFDTWVRGFVAQYEQVEDQSHGQQDEHE